MSASFFSISTRRVSLSLYQRARYASSVQGTFPASQHLRDGISQAPPQESTIPEKGEKKPKPKLYTELNGGTILKIHDKRRSRLPPGAFERDFLINTSLLYDKEALSACDKRTRQLFDEVRKERLSFTQTSIGDVESGNKKSSHGPSQATQRGRGRQHTKGQDVRPVVTDSSGYLPNGVYPEFLKNEETMGNMKVEKMEFLTDTRNMIGGMHLSSIGRIPFQDSQFMPADSDYPSFFPGDIVFEDSESVQQSSCAPYISSEGQSFNVKDEGDEMVMPYQNTFQNNNAELNAGLENFDFFRGEDWATIVKTENANSYQDLIDKTANKSPGNIGNLNSRSLNKYISVAWASVTNGKQYNYGMSELESKPSEYKSIDSQLSKRSTEGSNDEDDCDVCIIEDISHPAPTSRFAKLENSLNMSQSSRFDYTQTYMAGGTRPKARDKQYILRVALQDLSQPKSEVSLPDGLPAVPLLRHQRIALSWMVQKETSSLYCSGGILADDQGLGKTVSTIALILKEMP